MGAATEGMGIALAAAALLYGIVSSLSPTHSLPGKSLVLLSALLVVFLVVPFSIESDVMGLIARGTIMLILCLGGYLLLRGRTWVMGYIMIALPALLVGLAKELRRDLEGVAAASEALSALVLLLLFIAVIRFSLFQRAASQPDRIVAGVCGYLILALLWGNLYQFADTFVEDGFRTPEGVGPLTDNGAALYYSVVTITTLGYGEITPVNPWMRMLASLQALVATLFLAVFIASLISRQPEVPSEPE